MARIEKSSRPAGKDERLWRRILSESFPLDEFLRQLLGDWDARETPLGLAQSANLALVGGFLDLERAAIRIETIPPQTKQLTWPEYIGHAGFNLQ